MNGDILVPDLSPAELVALAKEKIDFTHLDSNFDTWNFCRYHSSEGQPVRSLEVRGKRYEVLVWDASRFCITQDVREHFKDLGADGNTAAFIAWTAETKPRGRYACIPSDDALLFRGADGRLCTPCFYIGSKGRQLFLVDVECVWTEGWMHVAFRAVSS